MKINIYSNNANQNSDVIKIFDSIVALYQGGFVGKELIAHASEDVIVTPSHEFVKASGGKNNSSDTEMKMTAKGATWFTGVRNKKNIENEFAIWQRFIEEIADDFHKNFSYLEYPQFDLTKEKNADEKDATLIDNVMSNLATHIRDYKVVKAIKSPTEDIYGATMRLEITDGTGEALPILGKIYFNNINGGGMQPMYAYEAKILGEMLSEYVGDNEFDATTIANNSGERIAAIMKSLDELMQQDKDFSQHLSIEDKRDIKSMHDLVERGANDEVDVICNRAKVLSLFHIKYYPRAYDIISNNTVIFRATVGLGDRLSISCAVCSDDKGSRRKILDNNNIIFIGDDSLRRAVPINCNLSDIGMSDFDEAKIDIIKENNPFEKHATMVQCSHIRMDVPCKRFVCQGEYFVVEDENNQGNNGAANSKKLCVECPFAEIVYSDTEGGQYPTSQLAYCCDTNTLSPKANTKKCKICGRTYLASYFDSGQQVCSFCNKLFDSTADDKAKMLYKKYSSVLPIWSRIYTAGMPKTAIENDEMILFNMAGCIKMLDKQLLKPNKPIPTPKTVYNVKGGSDDAK